MNQKRCQCCNRWKSKYLPNPHRIYRYTNNFFCKFHWIKATDVCQKPIPRIFKLFPFYDEIPEEFLDETYIDCYFYLIIFNASQLQHRIARVRKGSYKKSSAIKLFQFCDLKTRQRYSLQEEMNVSKKELSSLVNNFHDFLKNFDKARNCFQIPFRNPKLRLDLPNQKTISPPIAITISLTIQTDIIAFVPIWKQWVLHLFHQKFELHCDQFKLTDIFNLSIAKFTNSTGIVITLQTSVEKMTVITVCTALTNDCWYDKSIIKPIGNVFCPNTMCSDVLACTKDFSNSRWRQLSMSSLHFHLSGAHYLFWRTNKTVFLQV